MKKAHGEHNRDVCDFLIKDTHYNDWIITTAFYSAIHFIDHKIFPLTLKGKTINSIDEARRILNLNGRHGTRQHLVSTQLTDQKANYSFLDKNCRNARYINYAVSNSKAKIARQRLEQIIARCS
ncbi:MAG: hypothetical protein IPP69_06295 [Flavobacteriales bacterium]|nr:hypothetical protein [Flavobacteriales bacterium]